MTSVIKQERQANNDTHVHWDQTWTNFSVITYLSQLSNIILCPCGVGVQSDPSTATLSDLLCVSIWFLTILDSSTRALWQWPAQISSSEVEETLRRNGHQTLSMKYLFHTRRVFNMLYNFTTWDRRLYFPSERNRATDFYRYLKIHRSRPGLNPRILGKMASMLSLNHRGQWSNGN
jgi:hypothetical protein